MAGVRIRASPQRIRASPQENPQRSGASSTRPARTEIARIGVALAGLDEPEGAVRVGRALPMWTLRPGGTKGKRSVNAPPERPVIDQCRCLLAAISGRARAPGPGPGRWPASRSLGVYGASRTVTPCPQVPGMFGVRLITLHLW